MGEWITIPAFADDTIVRATVFQDIWANLYSLKDGEFDIQQMPGESSDFWSITSNTYVAVNANYYTLTFESFGGDLMIVANIETSNTGATGNPELTLLLDGVELGGSDGLHFKGDGDIFEAVPLIFMATGVAAGTHTIYVAGRDVGAETTKVFKKSCMNFHITELS
jgi:hypothetical protein